MKKLLAALLTILLLTQPSFARIISDSNLGGPGGYWVTYIVTPSGIILRSSDWGLLLCRVFHINCLT